MSQGVPDWCGVVDQISQTEQQCGSFAAGGARPLVIAGRLGSSHGVIDILGSAVRKGCNLGTGERIETFKARTRSCLAIVASYVKRVLDGHGRAKS